MTKLRSWRRVPSRLGVLAFFVVMTAVMGAPHAHAQNAVPILRSDRTVVVAAGCQSNGASHPFTFALGFGSVLQQMNNNNELGPNEVYFDNMLGGTMHPHAPTQAAANALRANCTPIGGFVVRNAEQEEIYMWMAQQIHFMLDDTDVGLQRLCQRFVRFSNDTSVRCVESIPAPSLAAAIYGMLARGYKKFGFTEFEVYKMFKEPNSRNKVSFWRHDPAAPPGLQRLNWNATTNTVYWGAAGAHVPYQFQDLVANEGQLFYQNVVTGWLGNITYIAETAFPF